MNLEMLATLSQILYQSMPRKTYGIRILSMSDCNLLIIAVLLA